MDEIIKEGYTPTFYKKKRKVVNPLQRRKNRLNYLKNKNKIKLYNKRWRQRNKMVLKHRRLTRSLSRRK